MKNILLAIGLCAALTLTTACGSSGGLSSEEQQAADSMAKSWAGAGPSKSTAASNKCIAEKWVGSAGLEALRKAKAIDQKNKAVGSAPPQQMSKPIAKDFGNAVADCFETKSMRSELEKNMPQLSKKQVDTYLHCMDKLDRDLLAKAVADGRTSQQPTKASNDLQTAVTNCQTKSMGAAG